MNSDDEQEETSRPTADPRTWVDLAIAAAPRLREAGVTRLRIGDFELELGTPSPPPPAGTVDIPREMRMPEMRGPLDDPATFGLKEDRGVPRFARDSNDEDQEPED